MGPPAGRARGPEPRPGDPGTSFLTRRGLSGRRLGMPPWIHLMDMSLDRGPTLSTTRPRSPRCPSTSIQWPGIAFDLGGAGGPRLRDLHGSRNPCSAAPQPSMQPPRLLRLFAVPPFLLLGSLASADAITGRVVDSNGEGVAGVDIDFINLGSGGNPHELNDGTDAFGNFVTTLDPGVYEILFFPPPPPATVLLTGVRTPVTVIGTKNLGTITLATGVLLKGKTVTAGNVPVGDVRAEILDPITKTLLPVKNNTTNAFGIFQLAVPTQQLELELFTSGVVGQTLVPRAIPLEPIGTTDLGNVNLQTGFHVTGTVHRSTGTALPGADVDNIVQESDGPHVNHGI